MNGKLRVAFISAEAAPYAKSGELAEVAGSLPKYLASLGVEVSLFMPKYRSPGVESLDSRQVMKNLSVPLGEGRSKAQVFRSEEGKFNLFLIDNPKYYWRESIYGTGKGEYLDNDERFIFFNRAVLEFLLKARMETDIIHCNNWPTALVPLLLKTLFRQKAHFRKTSSLLTMHNVAYQGEFPPESLALTGLNWDFFQNGHGSLRGRFNFLKAGAKSADVITTVSSSYRQEILTKKHGFGMAEILEPRRNVLFSIRNGIDYEAWNSEKDVFISKNYSASDMKGKALCKRDLQRELKLKVAPRTPLIGFISYLTSHKGVDLLLESVDVLMKRNVALVVMGRGDDSYEKQLIAARKKYPGRMVWEPEGVPSRLHKIFAGIDFCLIPSYSEPCGLNQMVSFRYGTVPVVRATGGLKETVSEYGESHPRGNGFVFREYRPEALVAAVERGLRCYGHPESWGQVRRNGMNENYSWEKAAQRYLRIYRNTLKFKTGGKSV